MKKIILFFTFLLLPHPLIAMHCFKPQQTKKSPQMSGALGTCISGIQQNKIKMVKKGLKKGAPINSTNPLHDLVTLASFHGTPEILQLLLQNPEVDINCHGAIHKALLRKHSKIIPLLLEYPTRDINLLYRGATLLQLATIYEDSETVALLLREKDIDINLKHYEGYTALHFACINGNSNITKMLVDSQTDLLPLSKEKLTPLATAFINGTIANIDLKSLDAMIHAKDKKNNTQLHICAKSRMPRIKSFHDYINFLIHSGVNIWARNNGNFTAFDLALERFDRLNQLHNDSLFNSTKPRLCLKEQKNLLHKLSMQRDATLSFLYADINETRYAYFSLIYPFKDIRMLILFFYHLLDKKIEIRLRSKINKKKWGWHS